MTIMFTQIKDDLFRLNDVDFIKNFYEFIVIDNKICLNEKVYNFYIYLNFFNYIIIINYIIL